MDTRSTTNQPGTQRSFWDPDFWETEGLPTTWEEPTVTDSNQEINPAVATGDSSPTRRSPMLLLVGETPEKTKRIAPRTKPTGKPAATVPRPSKMVRRKPAKQQLDGIALWREAMKLAWHDQSGGKFTQAFTRTVMKLSPVFVADDALIPLTMGAATPISWGTNVVLAIGTTIYIGKVRKYRRQLESGR